MATTISPSPAGFIVYQTKNGPRTVEQMAAELHQVGWGGVGEVSQVYAHTTGGPVSPTGTSATTQSGPPVVRGASSPASSPAPGPSPTDPGADKFVPQGDLERSYQAANQAAYNAYLKSKLALDTEQQAWSHAQQAWQNTFNEAALSGTYQGKPTQAAQQQTFQQGIDTGQLTGTYNGAPTLAAQAEQNKTALGYLGLISNLKGPQDYGSYLRTLGSTPGGLRDLVSSAAGNYTPGGGTTGVAPTPATLGGLVGDAASGMSGGTSYGQYMQTAQGLPAPNQINAQSWNAYSPSQKQVLLGMYGQQGWDQSDVADLYQKSLPKYSFSPGTTGAVKF